MIYENNPSEGELYKLNNADEEILENLENQAQTEEDLSDEKLLAINNVLDHTVHSVNPELLVSEILATELNSVLACQRREDVDVCLDSALEEKEDDLLKESNINVNLKENEALIVDQDIRMNPVYIECGSLKVFNEAIKLCDETALNDARKFSDNTNLNSLNQIEIERNTTNSKQDDFSPVNNEDLQTDNPLNLETLNNGVSILNNDIISDMVENAFEELMLSNGENNSNKSVESIINEEGFKAENIDDIKNLISEANKIVDRNLSVSIESTNSELPISKDLVETLKINLDSYNFSEPITGSTKIEQKDDKKIKKHDKKSKFRIFLERYPLYIFFSLGGLVMSYIVYRRFSRHN